MALGADDHVVVVGASLAGLRAAEALRELGFAGALTIVGDEPVRPYDRPPLSKQFLTGAVDEAALALSTRLELDATWLLGHRATGVEVDGRVLSVEDGSASGSSGGFELAFDGLVVATGCRPRSLPSLEPLAGVQVLRNLDDAVALRSRLVPGARLVVVGAGFIGLEVAASARSLGLEVTVVEVADVPLAHAVGPEMGAIIADLHRQHGVRLRLGTGVAGMAGAGVDGAAGVGGAAGAGVDGAAGAGVDGAAGAGVDGAAGAGVGSAGRVTGVRLTDGEVLPADVVVVGIGVTPATGWLEGSGVDLDNGVLADSRLRVLRGGVPLPHVVAAGDVVRWDHPEVAGPVRVEHWTHAVESARAAAASLLRDDQAEGFAPVPYFWSDQYDRKVQVVGLPRPGDEVMVVDGSPGEGRFVAAYGREGRLVAALGFSRPAKVMALQRQIAEGAAWPPSA